MANDCCDGALAQCLLHKVVPIEPLAFYGEEKISRLSGSRIYGISLSYDTAIVAPRCGYEFSNSRERQLHGFFPAVAVAASQTYPASRGTFCATCLSSKGIGPTLLSRLFFWPFSPILTMFPRPALF